MAVTNHSRLAVTKTYESFVFSRSTSPRRLFLTLSLLGFMISFVVHSYAICTKHWFEDGEYHVGLWTLCNYTFSENTDACDTTFHLPNKGYLTASLNLHCLGWIIEAMGMFFAASKAFSFNEGDEAISVPGLALSGICTALSICVGLLLLIPIAEYLHFGSSFYVGTAASVLFFVNGVVCAVAWAYWGLHPLDAALKDDEVEESYVEGKDRAGSF